MQIETDVQVLPMKIDYGDFQALFSEYSLRKFFVSALAVTLLLIIK